ncbi:MRN complex-interacting protein isoform X2 [Ictalurus punctatus]|uniref:MRN complex-interacting protein isoform X2 n=1 Tax=Ictalurus punctatus TaxID=7998 RepID=A0A9F7RMC3_ICTPU|nr:MRN complex-interacting protein isoform X2 [Ictalurus punctatus]
MVQEFHVLRCFSCRTFQVQQVKKSKKWSCKLCGEKQSLIKEYGRGTGADCRRHVQKLNSLRGELLEVETERARTRWEEEEEECGVEVGPGDETQNLEQKTRVVSRWSKYVDRGENGPEGDDEHQEEEENVYTDTEQCRQRNIRKRKKSSTSGDARGRGTAGGDEDADAARCGAMRLPSQYACLACFHIAPSYYRSLVGMATPSNRRLWYRTLQKDSHAPVQARELMLFVVLRLHHWARNTLAHIMVPSPPLEQISSLLQS